MTDENLSYINSLPNEVLARIFSTLTNRRQRLQELPSPALLSSVCHHWRMLAQNTPELWVNIIAPLHKSLEDSRTWTAEWITRSGVLLISVTINSEMTEHPNDPGIIEPYFTNIMDLLSQHSERLRRLALYSYYGAIIADAVAQLRSAPNLEQLTTWNQTTSTSWIEPQDHTQRQYSADFPRLATLKAQGGVIPLVSNLTSLTIYCLPASYELMSRIFTTSPCLKHLTLHLIQMRVNPFAQSGPLIRADSLLSLALTVSSLHLPRLDGLPALKYLAMPNIKYLELDGEDWIISDFGQSLSSAQIDTLRISNRSEKSYDADVVNFFHSFSTVRHLQLIHASTRLLSNNVPSLVRKNSIHINFHNRSPSRPPDMPLANMDIITTSQPKQSVPPNVWPKLRKISLDTLTAGDVLNLCDFVVSHKHVEVVELSKSARRHLSSSLRRKGDNIYQRPSLYKAAGGEEGLNDVEEWLSKMVEIRTFHAPSVGLLDAD